MNPPSAFAWSSWAVSHVGTVRKINEDAFLDRPADGLWVVADGMGGHAAGDVASRMIVDALASLPTSDRLDERISQLEDRLLEVNRSLLALAVERRKQTIGSTVAALIVGNGYGVVAWAGDSRVYRHRRGKLEQLTQDHAMVEDLVEVGLMSRAEAENHPQSNRITRAIGATETLFLDLEIYELAAGDRFLLCSDGLYKELADEDLAKVLGSRVPDPAARLVELAVERGARDNVTAIVVGIGKAK
ncbi:MAG TPA: protein phosphatase 2C domain-containing protein [Gammaproteobacteria bacterium]|nr:protein phosphatase 2C domain-containing protein [Gammaproteobacteria bacterium]